MWLRYLIGAILVLGLLGISAYSTVSIVVKIRDFVKRKKSPEEGEESKDVMSPSDSSGKEVDE